MPRGGVRAHELNLERRLTRVEQILPTLATKADVETAISAAVAPLATKDELDEKLAAAIAPLATKKELAAAIASLATKADLDEKLAAVETSLRTEIRTSAERTEHRVQVLLEGIDGKLDYVVEGMQASRTRIEDVRIELKEDLAQLDRRVMRLEAAQLKRR